MNDKPLSSRQFKLLTTVVDNYSVFDKHDNCFQVDTKVMATKTKLPLRTVQRLLKDLKERDLTKKVKDITGVTRLMLNPSFLFNHHKEEYYFTKAQYVLGSYELACEWCDNCRAIGYLIDPDSGEVISDYDYSLMGEYRDSYTCNDRTKQRSKEIKNVNVNCAKGITEEDKEFFDVINETSEHTYK